MQTTEKGIDCMNGLLRGELSAAETYQQALEMVGDDPGADRLRRIHREHVDAANTWRKHVHQFGGAPDQDSGSWGGFAKAVEGTAKLFGNTSALKALKEGEEHGINDYESALDDDDLPAECKTMIRSTLLPQTREHVRVLDEVMDRQ